ncbi:class II fructose-bisphosphate aldolase [Enterococcus casseliflavus]|uniref:class II fructose-bisphosphate aldolase n=1 Tax=Enterococcus casseliflavus TaxID=37734 RepID=UPI003D10DB95
MLTSMKEMLEHANENNYAVMAINCINLEIAKAIIHAAEDCHSPVIINISPRQFKAHATLEMIIPMIKKRSEQAHVPIAINLDHGQEFEDIVYAMQSGFTSIMFDGSSLPYEENIKRSQLIRALTREYGCSLETELGHVGQAQSRDNSREDYLTDPDQAIDFVRRTKTDFLAVAVGTAHGEYPKGMTPKIDFQRLKELKEKLRIPLVLHGGSGAGEENIKTAVKCGINKINVCTDLFNVGRDTMKSEIEKNPNIELLLLEMAVEAAMKNYIMAYMKMIGSTNRYMYTSQNMTIVE